jgi:5-methylcytosine-specific restriction endonuclease McrA
MVWRCGFLILPSILNSSLGKNIITRPSSIDISSSYWVIIIYLPTVENILRMASSRKYTFDLLHVITLKADEIFTRLGKKYAIHYVSIYSHNQMTYLYIHFKNVVVSKMVMRMLDSMDIIYTDYSSCKLPHGKILSEHGISLIHGKKKKVEHQAVWPPKFTSNPAIKTVRSVHKQTSTPKNLPGIPEIEDPDKDFHAIWGSDRLGLWYPIGYVGPQASIVPGKRRAVPQHQVDRLFVEQDSSCASCGCDVFMGKRSNADVDHIIPLRLGGSCSPSNLQVLCVTCHRRKTALECKKIRCNVVVGPKIPLEDECLYIACSDVNDPDTQIGEKNPKEALSNRDGLYKLVY